MLGCANRTNQSFRGYAGTVVSGSIHVGDEVVVLPSQELHPLLVLLPHGQLPLLQDIPGGLLPFHLRRDGLGEIPKQLNHELLLRVDLRLRRIDCLLQLPEGALLLAL